MQDSSYKFRLVGSLLIVLCVVFGASGFLFFGYLRRVNPLLTSKINTDASHIGNPCQKSTLVGAWHVYGGMYPVTSPSPSQQQQSLTAYEFDADDSYVKVTPRAGVSGAAQPVQSKGVYAVEGYALRLSADQHEGETISCTVATADTANQLQVPVIQVGDVIINFANSQSHTNTMYFLRKQ